MLNVAICDDNKQVCHTLRNELSEYAIINSVEFNINIFYSGESLIDHLKTLCCFDLIFLDIELVTTTGVIIGNKIRKQLDDYNTKIVFISAVRGYEDQLFDIQPFNFLRKPIKRESLFSCLDLAVKLSTEEKLFFEYKIRHEVIKVSLNKIIFFENKLRKIRILTVYDCQEFYGTFNDLLKRLPKTFIQVHGSFIVNYNYIEKITKKSITMTNGDEVAVSKNYLPRIYELQMALMREKRDANV